MINDRERYQLAHQDTAFQADLIEDQIDSVPTSPAYNPAPHPEGRAVTDDQVRAQRETEVSRAEELADAAAARQEHESYTNWQRFRCYLRQPRPRSLQATADELGLSLPTIKRCSASGRWIARAQAVDQWRDRQDAAAVAHEVDRITAATCRTAMQWISVLGARIDMLDPSEIPVREIPAMVRAATRLLEWADAQSHAAERQARNALRNEEELFCGAQAVALPDDRAEIRSADADVDTALAGGDPDAVRDAVRRRDRAELDAADERQAHATVTRQGGVTALADV